jgi:hypothetical protein
MVAGRRGVLAAAVALCLTAAGCMKPLQEHTAALAAATAPVVSQAAEAYRDANAIHEMRAEYDAIPAFERDHSIDALRVVHPLIADADVEVRLKVLAAFQVYVKDLVAIANGASSPELDAAAKSAGGALTGLGNTVGPEVGSALGLPEASAAATTAATPPISQGAQNALSTGINALGQFLISRTVQKELPQKIEALDPQVLALCKVMLQEIDAMSDAEKIDFNYMLTQQKIFVMDPSVTLSEVERRHEIEKMQELVQKQHAAELKLAGLRTAIVKLAMTHHALAAAEQGNNPLSLKQKLEELEAVGANLGKFYMSLPAS